MLDVDEVHRAAEPTASPSSRPISSAITALERRALGDRVAVRAVLRCRPRRRRAAGRRRPTATASWPTLRCTRPCTSSARVELADALLERADPPHRRRSSRPTPPSSRPRPRTLGATGAAEHLLHGGDDLRPRRAGRTASIGSLYGIVASSAVTSTIGAFSDEKPSLGHLRRDHRRRPSVPRRLVDDARAGRSSRPTRGSSPCRAARACAGRSPRRSMPSRGELLGRRERPADRPADRRRS